MDGVGLQSHIRLDTNVFEPGAYRRFLRELALRGLRIVLTELDVFDRRGGPEVAKQDANVAAFYRTFLQTALDEAAVKAVVFWGMSDRYSWIKPDRGPNYARPDGQPSRPLPFDDRFEPKPAFSAIMDALRAAPRRQPG